MHGTWQRMGTAWRALLAASWLGLGLAASVSAAPPAGGERVILVIQKAGPHRAVDDAVARHLSERGYAVQVEDQQATPDVAAGAALVVISSTVSGKDVDPGWRHVAVPLLTWENDILDDLAMTGKRHDVDFGAQVKERFLWIVNAPHPMAGGLAAGVANVYVKQAGMGWGKPGLGATTIATIYGEPGKAAIFGYEKGATMDYESLAPARRVMVFLDNDTFVNLSDSGRTLFDAAVDWASGRR
ncbi:hypothetical protein CDN99_08095 [Roseateles aquatilis]|uniref:Lipoprotein transmembrane n=1 Tax=Roseateles aquatilis TaxID=431061 RepID=A0A246JI27_9BURK|nr:hypothetical protein [Roseateles aquatilis]OWQ92284.1 hypothetical protein CDN99_08095 [Roseateles aquatilis]